MSGSNQIARVPFFSYGFRTFFFSGALWAIIAVLVWVLWLTGSLGYPVPYGGIAWHAHELLFGYGTAIVAGFLLTAVANWTGRPPLVGYPLLALWLAWLGGRLAFFFADSIGYLPAAIVDSLFLLLLASLIAREIIAGKNLRNLRVVAIVVLMMLVNMGFHIEYLATGYPTYALRAVVSLFVILIAVMGGRIIPAFTRNWLMKQGRTQGLPTSFNRFDMLIMIVSIGALLLWTAIPQGAATGALLLAAGILQLWRMARWSGMQTWAEPLVLILHIGYLFVGIGFVLVGISALGNNIVMQPAALHAWTTGAIGIMTLAMMTRTSRGHTGHPLTAPPATYCIYLLIITASVLRLVVILLPDSSVSLQVAAALAWLGAFVLFVGCYGPMLLRVRRG